MPWLARKLLLAPRWCCLLLATSSFFLPSCRGVAEEGDGTTAATSRNEGAAPSSDSDEWWAVDRHLEACDGDDKVERTDVVVVGCGLAGLFATAHLQRERIDVVLLEADPEVCGGRLRSRTLGGGIRDGDGNKINVEEAANFMYGTKFQGDAKFRENPTHRLFEGYGLDFIFYSFTDLVSARWSVYSVHWNSLRRRPA